MPGVHRPLQKIHAALIKFKRSFLILKCAGKRRVEILCRHERRFVQAVPLGMRTDENSPNKPQAQACKICKWILLKDSREAPDNGYHHPPIALLKLFEGLLGFT